MIEDGFKISELNRASELNDSDLIPIVSNGGTYNITASDFKGNLTSIGDKYFYTYSGLKTNQGASAWHTCYDNKTTDELPTGTYLIIFTATFSRYDGSTLALHTIRPVIDGTTHDRRCTSVISNLTSTLQVIVTTTFNTSATHTINLEGYSSVAWSVTGTNSAEFIKIK